jgi:hypothetical protein
MVHLSNVRAKDGAPRIENTGIELGSGPSEVPGEIGLGPVHGSGMGSLLKKLGLVAAVTSLAFGMGGCAMMQLGSRIGPPTGAPLANMSCAQLQNVQAPSVDSLNMSAPTNGPTAADNDSDGAQPQGIKGVLVSKLLKMVNGRLETGITESRTIANLPADGALGVHFTAKKVASDDATAQQKRYLAAHPGQAFFEVDALADVTGLGLSAPFNSGMFNASIGFTAGGSLKISTINPYGLNPDQIPILKTQLLATRQQLRDFAKISGAEQILEGAGNFGVNGSAGIGAHTTAGPLDVSATLGVQGSVVATGDLQIRMLSLGDGRVFVKVSKVGDITANESGGITAGATLNDDAITRFRASLPKNALSDYLAGRATDTVKSKVEEYLAFQAQVSASQEKSMTRVAGFILDTRDDTQADAALALRHLEAGPALKAISQGKGAQFVMGEDDSATGRGALVQLGPWKLALLNRLRQDRQFDITTSDGLRRLGFESTFTQNKKGLFHGQRDVAWQGYVTCQNGSSLNYYKLTFTNRDVPADPGNAPREIAFWQRASAAIGAKVDVSGKAESHGLFWHVNPANWGGAKATETVTVWFSGPRIEQRVRTLTPQLIERVWTEKLRILRGWKEPTAWSMANPEHELANRLLDQWGKGGSQAELARQQYGDHFRADIARDYEYRDELRFGIQLAMKLKTMPVESYASAFADLGQRDGDHVWVHLATFFEMVGADETFIESFKLEGNGLKAVAKDSATPTVKGFDDARDELTVPQ